ncbi:hypothetical protein GCM10028796_57850 [Ramlibacter monticola]|uniref:DUF455 family protein n=1 Tax=Ramlibacter monticola TaxID=1926872 RepID=A0A937CT29_9BURK|nr:DUF455 family protein [Ramlibacter monticola]MBL0391831.1 DUF455 family protein [Ramlibacter monticola]
MHTMEIGTVTVRGNVVLRASPAREPCFNVVDDQARMAKFPEGSLEHRREMLHGDVNEEVQSLEIAAQSLVDFPDADWELRLQLARQCWDEVRHARLFLHRLIELGGHKGEFPVINQEWGVVCMFDSLVGRLAVQNRLFEGGSLDVFKEGVVSWARWGDHATAEIMDAVAADEVQHVRFANEWFERLRKENPRSLLKAIAAMDAVRVWSLALTPPEMKMEHEIPVNVEDRRDAGFTVE